MSAANSQSTGVCSETASHVSRFVGTSVHWPSTYWLTMRAAVISKDRPGTGLPSMSVTTAPMSSPSPALTKVRLERTPT